MGSTKTKHKRTKDKEGKAALSPKTLTIPPNTVDTISLDDQEQILVGEDSQVLLIMPEHKVSRTLILKRKAQVRLVACCLDSTQSQVTTRLAEEGAAITIAVLVLGKSQQNFQMRYEQIHQAPHTSSNLLVKGALDGSAKLVFTGLIQVNAPGCNGYQKEEVLLLSRQAQANLIPDLEIHHNDVKCTHGAAVSHLNEEQLFYATSRGIAEKAARQMLALGFLSPVLKDLPDTLKEQVERKIENEV